MTGSLIIFKLILLLHIVFNVIMHIMQDIWQGIEFAQSKPQARVDVSAHSYSKVLQHYM